uniref:Uncharacterized protein n=1 Tax=Panagrolaimus superbus TaxID=310955 RepID=A0A914YUT8_9BILA
MLTSKTGANSCCYYTPHPDGEHLCYKWTVNGISKNVKWYACAGCKSAKNKDKTKPKPPNSKRDEEAETWIINPMDLYDHHYCNPLETSKERGKQIIFTQKKEIINNGGSVKSHIGKAEVAITQKYIIGTFRCTIEY